MRFTVSMNVYIETFVNMTAASADGSSIQHPGLNDFWICFSLCPEVDVLVLSCFSSEFFSFDTKTNKHEYKLKTVNKI